MIKQFPDYYQFFNQQRTLKFILKIGKCTQAPDNKRSFFLPAKLVQQTRKQVTLALGICAVAIRSISTRSSMLNIAFPFPDCENTDDNFIKHLACPFKNVQMAIGYRIKTPRANCSAHFINLLKSALQTVNFGNILKALFYTKCNIPLIAAPFIYCNMFSHFCKTYKANFCFAVSFAAHKFKLRRQCSKLVMCRMFGN